MTGPPATTAGYLVVANQAAGSTDAEAVEAAVGRLGRHAGVELRRTADPDELDDALAAAAGRTVVVAGGDGSLHLALVRLRAAGRLAATPVGLVPLGTGNDFARGVGLALDPVAAADAIVVGASRRVDLVVADDDDVVVNVAHAGVGAEAALAAEAAKGPLGRLAYPLGALRTGVSYRGVELDVVVDGQPLDSGGRALLVAVGNGASIGGGTAMVPGAFPDDGLVDVVVARPHGWRERARFAYELRRGTHLGLDCVHSARGREVTVVGEPVRHDVDGEVGPPVTSRTYRVEPAAWTLVGVADAGPDPRPPRDGAAAERGR